VKAPTAVDVMLLAFKSLGIARIQNYFLGSNCIQESSTYRKSILPRPAKDPASIEVI
jgi:hypothetical protein